MLPFSPRNTRPEQKGKRKREKKNEDPAATRTKEESQKQRSTNQKGGAVFELVQGKKCDGEAFFEVEAPVHRKLLSIRSASSAKAQN